jgi:hypothetical protein
MTLKKRALATLAVAAVAAVSFAAVAVADHSYFVGKGEVQDALGWNNAALQAGAESVGFYYTTGRVGLRCVHVNDHANVQIRWSSESISSTLLTVVDRKNPQGSVNGFWLNGEELDDAIDGSGDSDVPTECPNPNRFPDGYVNDEASAGLFVSLDGGETLAGPIAYN